MPFHGIAALAASVFLFGHTDSPVIMFQAGAIINFALQYVTGLLLETVFGICFWDFSHHRYSIHGRVNFAAVPVNGLFTMFLIIFAHGPVTEAIVLIPGSIARIAAAVLICIAGADAMCVVRHLVRLNELLSNLGKSRLYGSAVQARLRRDMPQNKRLFSAFPRMRHRHYPDALRKIKRFITGAPGMPSLTK